MCGASIESPLTFCTRCYTCKKHKFLLSKGPLIGSSLLFICGVMHVKRLSFCWVRDCRSGQEPLLFCMRCYAYKKAKFLLSKGPSFGSRAPSFYMRCYACKKSKFCWVGDRRSGRELLPGAPLSTSGRQIFRVWSEGTQVSEINLMWTQDTWFLDWFGTSYKVIAIRPVLMYYVIEIDSSIFLSGSFKGFPGMSSACPRCGSIISIYS
jgi:hypothetical protein